MFDLYIFLLDNFVNVYYNLEDYIKYLQKPKFYLCFPLKWFQFFVFCFIRNLLNYGINTVFWIIYYTGNIPTKLSYEFNKNENQ